MGLPHADLMQTLQAATPSGSDGDSKRAASRRNGQVHCSILVPVRPVEILNSHLLFLLIRVYRYGHVVMPRSRFPGAGTSCSAARSERASGSRRRARLADDGAYGYGATARHPSHRRRHTLTQHPMCCRKIAPSASSVAQLVRRIRNRASKRRIRNHASKGMQLMACLYCTDTTLLQSTNYWKNASQQGLPFTLNPAVLYRGMLSPVTLAPIRHKHDTLAQ